MYHCNVVIGRGTRFIRLRACVDTGYDGGLMIDRKLAKRAGAIIVEATRLPTDLMGEEIGGKASVLLVTADGSEIDPFQTPVFCPSEEIGEVILGAYWLAQAGAVLHIGELKVRAPRANPNPFEADLYDHGHVVVRPR